MKSPLLLGAALLTSVAFAPRPARAHCDTLDGPVIEDARVALEARDVTPVLRWVKADREAEIRAAFSRTLAVRGIAPEVRDLADRFFFETLVRVHRAGEGAPYTGLKPAGTEVEPVVAASDTALESGSVEPLVHLINRGVSQRLRERYGRAAAARLHAAESVERGREYVEAYVQFVHYAEQLMAAGASAHGEPAEHEH